MIDVLMHAAGVIAVLVAVAGLGYWTSHKNWYDDKGRALVARIVNLSIPFFLFYSVISKFSHDQLMEIVKLAYLPFVTVGINFAISLMIVRIGWVRDEWKGTFIASFTGATVLFVGVPVVSAMFGEAAIPYLLVYFFSNVVFIWVIGLYCVQWDGVRRRGGAKPRLISAKSLRMFFSGPLLGFLAGLAVVVLSVPVPKPVSLATHMIGQIANPLALIFIGMTIHRVGFERLRHMPREVWLVLLSCFVIRPAVMYLCSMPLEMDPLMRKCFIVAAALPVTSVIAVMARHYGADEEFASEAVGMSTVGLLFALSFVLVAVSFI